MQRREYNIQITINGRKIAKVIVDPHYEMKHSGSVNDDIILRLVELLDNLHFEPDEVDPPYEYFATDGLMLDGKKYRLVWLLEDELLYIGVVNAYRR